MAEHDENTLVSIIMTSFNTERYLPFALDAVLAQSHANWELLIADDASADGSRAVIDQYAEKDARIKALHNEENQHYLRTRNRLIELAKGEFITFLDSDDGMEVTRIEEQLNFMRSNPELTLCGCFVKYLDQHGNPLKVQKQEPPTLHEDIVRIMPSENPITGSTIFIKREVLQNLGGYRDFFHGRCSEDYDLVSRLSEDHKVGNLARELYIYRQFEASTSRAALGDPYKRFSGKIVQQLIQERREGAKDAIDRGDDATIARWVSTFAAPYKEDPSKFYIDQVSSHLYSGLKKKAVASAWKAIVANPRRSYNYRTFWYTIKQLFV